MLRRAAAFVRLAIAVACSGDRVTWEPPARGSALYYRYRVDHRRRGGGYDAKIGPHWAIVRGDDLVPARATRYEKALAWMQRHARGIEHLRTRRSTGSTTARAVLLFHALDREIAARSGGQATLDNVTRALMPVREVSFDALRVAARIAIGAPARVLESPLLADPPPPTAADST